mgnify:CR=1 FL=1
MASQELALPPRKHDEERADPLFAGEESSSIGLSRRDTGSEQFFKVALSQGEDASAFTSGSSFGSGDEDSATAPAAPAAGGAELNAD